MKTSSYYLLRDARHQILCSYTTAAGLNRSFTADESPILNNNENVQLFLLQIQKLPFKNIVQSDYLHSAHSDMYI